MRESTENMSTRTLRTRNPMTQLNYTTIQIIDDFDDKTVKKDIKEKEKAQKEEKSLFKSSSSGSNRELQEAPIKKIGIDSEEMFKFCESVVKHQDVGIDTLCTGLAYALTNEKSQWSTDKARMYVATLCGTSGCGKTEAILRIKTLLGMDAGFEYENQFVKLDGSTLIEETQINCITGGAAGLVGYKDGGSLAEQLNNALKNYKSARLRTLQAMKEADDPEYKEQYALYRAETKSLEDGVEKPPYILLFIDEIDKADPLFMRAINGLLWTGAYTTPSGISFHLTDKTVLIILMTSNYGAEDISQMTYRNWDKAVAFIEEDMKYGSHRVETISRMGKVIPFYPLSDEAMKEVLISKWVNFVATSPLAQKYGHDKISYDKAVQDILINHVVEKVANEKGVRGAIKDLFDKLEPLFQKGLNALNRMLGTENNSKLKHPIRITSHMINMNEFCEIVDQELSDIITSIKNVRTNAEILKELDETGSTGGAITTIGMEYGGIQLHNSIINCTIKNTTNIHVHRKKESAELIESLEEKARKLTKEKATLMQEKNNLKTDYREFIQMLEEANSEDMTRLIQSRKQSLGEEEVVVEIEDEPSDGFCFSLPGEDDVDNSKKRKSDLPCLFDTIRNDKNKRMRFTQEKDGNKQTLQIKQEKKIQYHTSLDEMNELHLLDDFRVQRDDTSDEKFSETETEQQQQQQSTRTGKSNRGRPKKEFPGFTWLKTDKKLHRSQYKCNNCLEFISDSRLLKIHQCQQQQQQQNNSLYVDG